MIGRLVLLSTCMLSLSSAFIFDSTPEHIKWDGLHVTFGINPFDSHVFASLPRTASEATDDGWTKLSDCQNTGKFRGARYIKDSDRAVILLFDINGYIAGIQSGINSTATYPPIKQRGNIFQDDGHSYVLTAYYVDPATICTTGRSASEYTEQGTGMNLYIQNGTDPVHDSVMMPFKQSDIAHTEWTLGFCFPAMGVHYWYNVSEDMNCDDFHPVFLLYNKHQLTAFGWAVGSDENSSRFEHPPFATISSFMNPVPRCLSDYAHLSTMHIYMTAYPTADFC